MINKNKILQTLDNINNPSIRLYLLHKRVQYKAVINILYLLVLTLRQVGNADFLADKEVGTIKVGNWVFTFTNGIPLLRKKRSN